MSTLERTLERIDEGRAARLTLELVRIESPTGNTREVAARYARELEEIGLAVEVVRDYPDTPVVIGRLVGAGGPTLIFNGHLDTVPIPHPEPALRDGRVYGRGAFDMKGPMAAVAEMARAVVESGWEPPGTILIVAHGLHEAPGGVSEDLIAAIQSGRVRGDAAVVCEAGSRALPVLQLGMGIFTATFRRPGGVTHELQTAAGTPHPAAAAAEAVLAVEEFARDLEGRTLPYVGCETCFVGQVHCGDFYNRFPAEAVVQGTRRFRPGMAASEAAAELRRVLNVVAARRGVELEFRFDRVRDSYEIDPAHPLAQALLRAYAAECGSELPLTGNRLVADAPIFTREARIPAVYHGVEGEGAHGDLESVPVDELRRVARVYARMAEEFFAVSSR